MRSPHLKARPPDQPIAPPSTRQIARKIRIGSWLPGPAFPNSTPLVQAIALSSPVEITVEIPMQDFLNNVLRYPRFLISFSLGVVLTLLSPFTGLMQDRRSAIAVGCLFASALGFVFFTLRAMLGLAEVQ
ncbi:MAG: DUF751 family protein [Limnothrix sp. BL-A-16]